MQFTCEFFLRFILHRQVWLHTDSISIGLILTGSLGTGFTSNFVLIRHAHFHCGSVPVTYEFICKKRNISVKGNVPLLYVSLQHQIANTYKSN